MRYYDLTVIGQGLNYSLNEKNPFGLDVVFRIHSSFDVLYALPSTFEIINGDIKLFSDTQELRGKQVIFKAGIKSAPYLKNQQIEIHPNMLPLFFAEIDASFASWDITENRCTLAFSSSRPMMEDKTFVLNKGDAVASKAAEYLKTSLLRNNYTAKVLISPSALNTVFNNQTSTVFSFAKDKRLQGNLIVKLAEYLALFKLGIDYQANINTYTIYSTEEAGFTIDSVNTVIVQAASLLSQPVWEDAATVTLEMALDPRITLGSRLYIPTNLEMLSDPSGFKGTILKSAVDARILKNGFYSVKEVMHIGDSRNTDPKSWSTVCKCLFVN